MSYTDQLEKMRKADEAAQLAANNAAAWRQILETYDDVRDGEANFNVVLEWCEGQITMEKFRLLYETRPEGYQLALAERINGQWTDDRARLAAKIMEIVDPRGIRHTESLQSKYSRAAAVDHTGRRINPGFSVTAQDRATEQQRVTYINYEKALAYLDRVGLMDKLESLGVKAELRSKSLTETKQVLEAMRGPKPEPPRADGKPRLGQYVVPKGHSAAMEVTATNLKQLAKADYPAFRHLYDVYGAEQLTDRLQG